MKHTLIILLSIFILVGCKNQSELSKLYNCKTGNIKNTIAISDFKENFNISIPNSWKTNLYYDKNQSEIFAADTTKQLTETYIIDAAYNYGSLTFNNSFYKKTDSILKASNLKKVNSGTILFKEKPAYWYLSKGKKKGFDFHQFNLIVKTSKNAFFTSYCEIYGTTNIESRICESISIIDNIEFLQ
ncbi:hypothetical protein [Lutibacter citreus]|uniref:hypothetical protein n=1 Tax=Lutibacter citreus TaxID=2138210 RepID=UPI001300B7CA|nr:hypothetical protein [Lutibacter citreus]